MLDLLNSTESGAAIIGKQIKRSMNLGDVCIAEILTKITKNQKLSNRSTCFHEFVPSFRRHKKFNCPIADRWAHVASPLIPQFKKMIHKAFLDGDDAYHLTDMNIVKLISATSNGFFSDQDDLEQPSQVSKAVGSSRSHGKGSFHLSLTIPQPVGMMDIRALRMSFAYTWLLQRHKVIRVPSIFGD